VGLALDARSVLGAWDMRVSGYVSGLLKFSTFGTFETYLHTVSSTPPAQQFVPNGRTTNVRTLPCHISNSQHVIITEEARFKSPLTKMGLPTAAPSYATRRMLPNTATVVEVPITTTASTTVSTQWMSKTKNLALLLCLIFGLGVAVVVVFSTGVFIGLVVGVAASNPEGSRKLFPDVPIQGKHIVYAKIKDVMTLRGASAQVLPAGSLSTTIGCTPPVAPNPCHPPPVMHSHVHASVCTASSAA
jgi:hypothetical protein